METGNGRSDRGVAVVAAAGWAGRVRAEAAMEGRLTQVVMEPEVLVERLFALVPRPGRHLVTYHGVLAPAAGLRSRVVPRVEEDEVAADEGAVAVPAEPAVQAVLERCADQRRVVRERQHLVRDAGGGTWRRRRPGASVR
ncbi:MAG: transposase [Planctomycetes bacterium]|nr:transposase [Planctomycetota bacterium]